MTDDLTNAAEDVDPRLRDVIAVAKSQEWDYRQPAFTHFKVGRVNYFWTTGRVTVDGGMKVEQKGLHSFIDQILLSEGMRERVAAAVSGTPMTPIKRAPMSQFNETDPPF